MQKLSIEWQSIDKTEWIQKAMLARRQKNEAMQYGDGRIKALQQSIVANVSYTESS